MTMIQRIIAAAAVLAIVLLILYMQGCDARKALGDQARIEKGQTGAVIESGMDASNTQATIATNDVATADLDRSNEKDIRNAQGSNVAAAPDAHAAGMRALCRRKANLNRPECRVQ